MWGTSLPEDKLAGDLGNVIGATSIGGRRSDFFTARKWRRAIWDFCNKIGHKRTNELQQETLIPSSRRQAQERLGDRKTERLCGLEIDDKLELGWRLNRQISAAQNRNV